jgi:hypothetical protein
MHTLHEEPSLVRMELLGHLAAAARLAMAEAPDADGVAFNVTASADGFAVDCTYTVQGVPTSGWGQ